MLKAVIHNGSIVPLEPLPSNWSDGTKVSVEPAPALADLEVEADEWLRDMAAAMLDLDPNDADIINAAIRDMDRLAKEQVRREMGLP